MEILNQLGQLFLEAVPTVLIVFLFFLFLRPAFFRPMERVMAERRARMEGARQDAEAAQAAAQEKVRHYQEALKQARAEVYAEQQAARRAILGERAALVKETRRRAQQTIGAAKERIARETEAARHALESESDSLGQEIARAILRPATPGPSGARGAR